MNRSLHTLLLVLAVVVTAGCAHPIVITPDLAALTVPATPASNKNAGYVLTAENRALEVTTPGGGGDNIRYFPYRDLEVGLYKVLSSFFGSVTRLEKREPPTVLQARDLAVVVVPKITTTSSSDGFLTWPPTSFSVTIDCSIESAAGTPIGQARAVGFGRATYEEFSRDFQLAARRASIDALNKLSEELAKLEALRR